MSMIKILALPLFTATLSFAACSQAQDSAPNKVELTSSAPVTNAQTSASNWTVIDAESHVKFTAAQEGNEFTGQFNKFTAVINFDPSNIEDASVTARIDISSVDAGDKDRNGALPGKEWFFIKKFPEAVFQSSSFSKTGENTYAAAGTLSMKGVSQPLTLPFTLDIESSTADMSGMVTLDRTLWELGSGAWSTDEWVSTSVTVDIKIKAAAK